MALCKVNKYCSVFLLSLLTGFLASLPKPLGINNSLDITEDIELCPLYHIKSKKSVPLHDQIVGSPDVFVYGIQGKSRNVSLWPLHNLLASNANLREVDPNREAETGQYLLPQEGIQSVLCNKIVILHSWKKILELFWWIFLLAVLMSFNYPFFLFSPWWSHFMNRCQVVQYYVTADKNQCILTVFVIFVSLHMIIFTC